MNEPRKPAPPAIFQAGTGAHRLARLMARCGLRIPQAIANLRKQPGLSQHLLQRLRRVPSHDLVDNSDSIGSSIQSLTESSTPPDRPPIIPAPPTAQAPPQLDKAAIQATHARSVKDFEEKARARGFEQVSNYFWYHTVDLGNGLITPGDYDYRQSLACFQFPLNMRGMKVLDVGSATGFFAFEFERRGAEVISVDLPSIADWDMLIQEKQAILRAMSHSHQVGTVEEETHVHLEGPFEFCRNLLNSRVKRCYSRMDELTPAKLGIDHFDLIFAGDVLLHTFSPLKALDVLASLCRGTLVLTQDMANFGDGVPLMVYVGGEQPGGDSRSWWFPNQECLRQILRRLRFTQVAVVGQHAGYNQRTGDAYERTIIHAMK